MKKLFAMAMLCVAVLFSVSTTTVRAEIKINSDTTKTKAKMAKVVYTCPMHTDVISYKPGKCPKPNCGMTLVKKSDLKEKTAADKMKM
jgi:hypothetical protein